MRTLTIQDIKLKRPEAIKAAELFTQGLREGFEREPSDNVPLSKAVELLQAAYESVKDASDPAGIGD